MISTSNLTKYYTTKLVLDSVDLDFAPNQIHGLLGRNGTGKSTLLSILAGQVKASDGAVTMDGQPVFDNPDTMARTVYAGIDVPFPGSWKVRAIIDMAAKRWEPTFNTEIAQQLINEFGLDESARYDALSRGQRSMVGIVVGLAARCELTLLDEPYVGLDVANREIFYRTLMAEAQILPRTIILATHHIEESAKILDTVTVLGRDGRIAHRADVEKLDGAYVHVLGRGLGTNDGEIRRTEGAGLIDVLTTADNAALYQGATTRPAELDDVMTALIESS